MTASPICETVAKIIAAERKAPVERLEDVLSDLMGGIVIDPHRQSDPHFLGDQSRQRHWDALAEDMRRPCTEDSLR